MITKEFDLITSDSVAVHIYSWLPDEGKPVKGILQIAHGMAEHAARYADFAGFMVTNGYAVFANDHRGHGKTPVDIDDAGYLGNNSSWQDVLADMRMLNEQIHNDYPNQNVIMLGHSMGSFYARAYLELYTDTIQALILSGTAWQQSIMLNLGLMIAKIECFFRGNRFRSHLLDTLSFGAFNKKFEPAQTAFDWLSRDHNVCFNYSMDPLCGFVCTSSFFRELFRLLKVVHQKQLYADVDKNFPVYIFSGAMDPVGNFSKGPATMNEFLKNKGFSNITLKIYPEGRHEMLNEINKGEVYEDVLEFCKHL